MYNKFRNRMDVDEDAAFKSPTIVCIILIYVATLFLQNLKKPSLYGSLIFTAIMIAYLAVFLLSNIFKDKYWLYFAIQGIIIFGAAFTVPKGYQVLFIGIIPVLISQSIGIYYDIIKVICTFVFLYTIFCSTVVIINGASHLAETIPILFIIVIAMVAYSIIFFRQVKLRINTQKLLQELSLAYEKVEELTLINERQRMARDLHDTLSQGLAGIIMQLEAVNTNLNKNNIVRAQEIVQKSMGYARKTLADSRLVIDDLRLNEDLEVDFVNILEDEVAKFKNISNSVVKLEVSLKSEIALKVLEHMLYIVRECLNNVAKHSKAKNVDIKIVEKDNKININVIDDGIGFDVKSLYKVSGHYGMLGITERTHAVGGEIEIKSKKKYGTNINIFIPIGKGIVSKNE